jgi:hypothetical protein
LHLNNNNYSDDLFAHLLRFPNTYIEFNSREHILAYNFFVNIAFKYASSNISVPFEGMSQQSGISTDYICPSAITGWELSIFECNIDKRNYMQVCVHVN